MKIESLAIDKKFKDFVHYICAHGDSSLGAIKLNKILWLLDSAAFIHNGKSVTGSKYVKQQYGPVPQRIRRALDELENEKKIAISHSTYGIYQKRDFLSLVEPDTSRISKEEIEVASFLIDCVCKNHTANSISEMTHDIVWKAAKVGEEIPLEALLAAQPGEVTDKHMKWADEILGEKSI